MAPPESRPVKIYTIAGGTGSAIRQQPGVVQTTTVIGGPRIRVYFDTNRGADPVHGVF
jgi:hypothetical protein